MLIIHRFGLVQNFPLMYEVENICNTLPSQSSLLQNINNACPSTKKRQITSEISPPTIHISLSADCCYFFCKFFILFLFFLPFCEDKNDIEKFMCTHNVPISSINIQSIYVHDGPFHQLKAENHIPLTY